MYKVADKPWTSKASDWPQGYFKKKNCKNCGTLFEPNSPCNLFCTQDCARYGKASRYLTRTYGITLRDYEEMLKAQNSLCKICGGTGFKMKEHHDLLLVVDHCHKTGVIRGLLCHNCNRGLGLFKDSPEALQAAKDYLEGATTISKESTPKRVEAPDTER